MRNALFVLGLVMLAAAEVRPAALQLPGQTVSRPPDSRPDGVAPRPTRARDAGAPGTGVIRGRIQTVLGRPAVRATVRIVGLTGSDQTVFTDVDGRYEVGELKPDSYRVTASKAGFLTVDYGQTRILGRGTMVFLGDDQTVDSINITLFSAGAIAGRITDENGDPLQGVSVQALQSRFSGGRRQLLPVTDGEPRTTDDTGHYRLFGIPPGQYIVVASPRPLPLLLPGKNHPGYIPTYYPGSPAPPEAQPVSVGVSQTSSGVDFVLVSARSAIISGSAFDSTNRPLAGTVALTTTDRWGGLSIAVQARVNPDGSFQLVRVPPGDYVLQAIGPRPPDQRGEGEFAAMFLSVSGRDIDDLEMRTSAGSRAAGHVVREGDARGANPHDATLVFAPTDLGLAPANDMFLHRWRPETDGTFQMTGLAGPRRLRLLNAPPSWTIRSVSADGVDVTDEVLSFGTRADSIANLEVVLTTRAATLSGTVSDERNRPVLDYTAVVFAIDPRRWYPQSRFVKFSRPRPDATFSFQGLPAGEYYVAAVNTMQGDELGGEWQDSSFLDTISRGATRISVAEAEQATVSTRLIVR